MVTAHSRTRAIESGLSLIFRQRVSNSDTSLNPALMSQTLKIKAWLLILFDGSLTLVSSANFRVPIAQPLVALRAQKIPVERHALEGFVHPRGQLRAVNIRARGDAIIRLRRVREAFGRRDELVKATRLFFVRRAAHNGDAVRDDGCPGRGQVVRERQIFLLAEEMHVRQVPEADESFAAREFLDQQGSVSRVFRHVRVDPLGPIVAAGGPLGSLANPPTHRAAYRPHPT